MKLCLALLKIISSYVLFVLKLFLTIFTLKIKKMLHTILQQVSYYYRQRFRGEIFITMFSPDLSKIISALYAL